MPNPDDAAAWVEYHDAADRLEALQGEEMVGDRRREVLWWTAAAVAVSLGVLAGAEFFLLALYRVQWLWSRARRRRDRQAKAAELRERLRALAWMTQVVVLPLDTILVYDSQDSVPAISDLLERIQVHALSGG